MPRMQRKHRILLVAFAVVEATLGRHAVGATLPRTAVTVALVLDGPSERNAEIIALFEREVAEVVLGRWDVELQVAEGDWTIATVHRLNDRLLEEPGVDVVVGFGVIASQDLATRGSFPKPVMAPIVHEPGWQGIPQDGDKSGVHNLCYLKLPFTFERDVEFFRGIAPFRHLVELSSARYRDALPPLPATEDEIGRRLGVKLTRVWVELSADAALAQIPADADAVYVDAILHLSSAEFARLAAGLRERRLPSFSGLGAEEVQKGLLAGLNPDILPRIIRRVALNLHRILDGEDPATLASEFSAARRLYLNIELMHDLGLSPTWSTLLQGDLLSLSGARSNSHRVTLAEAMAEAQSANLDIAAVTQRVRAGEENVTIARSGLLPQVGLSGQATQIDHDRAQGTQAERSAAGSLRLTQLLWSEQARSGVAIATSLQSALESQLAQQHLDVALDAAVAYLELL